VGSVLFSTPPIYAEESAGFEEIGDVSPGGKFSVRISCIVKPEDQIQERRRSLLAQSIPPQRIGLESQI
jgi:hypothetical protein